MKRARLPLVTWTAAAACALALPVSAQTATASRTDVVNRYCVTCHNDKTRTGGLTLEHIDADRVGAALGTWERVVRKLRSGAMPPAGLPRPDKAVHDAFVRSLEAALDRVAEAAPNPGGSGVHRLNRVEYTNAIRDLLGLDVDGASLLPADTASYGFDNIADVLTVSPGLMDRYLSAAYRISRLAIGDPAMRPRIDTYNISPRVLQDSRMSEEMPFGSRGGTAIHHLFPVDGDYAITVLLGRSVSRTASVDVRLDGVRVKLLTAADAKRSEALTGQELQFHLPVRAGTRVLAVTFADSVPRKAVDETRLTPGEHPVSVGRGFNQVAIRTIQIDGPYNSTGPGNTASRAAIFVCRPSSPSDEEPCARRILTSLARRAYRRPATDADVRQLLDFYRAGRADKDFDTGIQRALERALVSFDFLFRVEAPSKKPVPGAPYRISDVELASRLSFFLWSSLPDDELLTVAARGELKNAAVLERQVRRMLADPKADALMENFGGQWLYLRNLRIAARASGVFPEFNDSLRDDFRRETELFLRAELREDRPVPDLLTANYSFLNDRLARHYGIPGVNGSHFRRVTFQGPRRGGLLGQASILTLTSYPNRTAPTLRGKWVLENILGAPPPPPPPDVEGLKEKDDQGQLLSMRARMERHRKSPVCASCHAQMDPIGFALENYDAIGRWRTRGEADVPIDASGLLPNGSKFNGPQELRTLLLSRREEFVSTVAEKLLTYALGRGLEPYDMPAVRKIRRDAAAGEFRWSALILGIVRSVPFQMRREES